MTQLAIALLAFAGTHFAMSHPWRRPMVARLGTARFQGVYTLVSFATFGWAIWAFGRAPSGDPLWAVGDGLLGIATAIMWFASILLAGSFLGNPALPMPGAEKLTHQPARGVFAVTRHPMMWSFALWALVHLLVSPRPPVLLLSGAIGVLALLGSYGQDHKKKILMGDAWRDWASRTSFLPFGNQLGARTAWSTAWPGVTIMLAGTLLWLVATWAHPMLGAPVAGIWHWLR